MLRYLINVTQGLLSAAILTGLLMACIFTEYGARGRRVTAVGAICGGVAAAVMAYLKNATALINTGRWNLRIFSVSLAALALFLIFTVPALRRRTKGVGAATVLGASAVLAFTFILYALPDVIAYPFTFSLGIDSFFSSAYILRLIGWLLGLGLMALTGIAAERAGRRIPAVCSVILRAVLAVNAVQQVSKMIQYMLARRIIPSNRVLFTFARYTSNYSGWFIYVAMLITLAIPIILWLRNLKATEPYENPAQHRRIKAGCRSSRRWAGLLLACFIMATLNMTVLASISNRPVELSPPEECEVRDDAVYVSLLQVEDGHLHRFVYTTPNGIDVRFIVIKKPNSSSYGIGLDACDICGETGYYERGGQIVCKLCDVVMNINTIGFKGGCNPIVIDYSIGDGFIRVPTQTLIEHEQEFK